MRSFSDIQNDYNVKVNESKKLTIDSERVQLLGAIKREYGIASFNSLSESERKVYTNMINSMWTPTEGLNDAGLKFINESEVTLTKDSSVEEIKKYILDDFKKNWQGYLEGITGKRFTGGSNPMMPSKLRKYVNDTVGKNYPASNFQDLFVKIMTELIKSSQNF